MPATVTNNSAFGGPNAQQAANANAALGIQPTMPNYIGTGTQLQPQTMKGTTDTSYVGQNGITYNNTTNLPVSQSPLMTAQVQNPISYGSNTAPAVYNASQASNYLGNVGTQIQNLNADSQAQSQSKAIGSQPQQTQDNSQTQNNSQSQPQNDTTDPAAQLNDQISSLLQNLGNDINSESQTTDSQGNNVSLGQAASDNSYQEAQAYQYYAGLLTQITNGTFPMSAQESQLISSTQSQFMAAIQQQQIAKSAMVGQSTEAYASLGINQTAPLQAIGGIFQAISAGNARVSDLDAQMTQAVSKLQTDYQTQNFQEVTDTWNMVSKQFSDRADAISKMQSDVAAKTKELTDYTMQIQKDRSDAVNSIAEEAAKNGADAQTLQAIAKAPDATSAIVAAGDSLQSSSNPDVSQYLFYKQQATAAGQTPMSYSDYQAQQTAIANSSAYSKAYATAAGSAAGAASALPTPDPSTPGTGLGGTSSGGSILAATGLSIAAFNYLTQGTASMSRMPAAQRTQIMSEAQNWLNKNGIDVSTFQSQYKSYNDVLQKNIERANQTKIMAGEVSGSTDALLSVLQPDQKQFAYQVAGGKLGNLSATNVLDLLAGKQVNSAFAQKYSFQIQTMANDLAGYFAASRGNASPDDSDKLDAANVISNGMNSTSAQAFKESIQANEEKVAGVVNNAVTSTQKQVWGLFGVGDSYKSPTNTTDNLVQNQQQDDAAAQQSVINYGSTNTQAQDTIKQMVSQGYSYSDIQQVLGI